MVMFRAIAIVGLIVGLVAAVVFGPRYLQNDSSSETAGIDRPACDLLAGPCTWADERGDWRMVLKPLGDDGQGQEYRLEIDAPVEPVRFLAVLRGESMYMGEYPVPLKRVASRTYEARFTAPVCTEDNAMVWRIDLQSGQAPLQGGGSMKPIFQAASHE
ncbi:hypothetical protein D777_01035 [Marinobacter nitratireducens]|uniref:Uncharacterized protein n=2 Tax=Marinobacter nitratireducens TaxID=1137280 RepID=A0A072N4E4_9GAMM|nr:hypothetical protein D777_01035 [Marinobacter nitratireducens]